MRTTRSRYALIAGIAGIALVAAGCSSNEPDTDDPVDPGTDSDEEITLTVATFNEFGYEGLIEEYMDLNPNIKVEQIKAATSNEARDKLNTSIAAGSGAADIEAIEVDWLPELMQYPDKFEDLSSPDVEGRWLDWKVAQATTPDGKLIGYGTDIGPEAICYRPDLFEEAGLPTDRDEVAALLEGDWEHYFSVGDDFVANSEAAWFDSANATFQAMINQLENAYEADDGSVLGLEGSEVEDLYNQILTASMDRELSAHLGQWSDDWFASFQGPTFATMACPGWMLGIVEGNAAGVSWDIADVFPGGGGNWGGSFLTVPVGSDNTAAAIELAAWLTAPEQQIKAFEAKGTFPSQVDALESPDLLGQVNAFFNDAPTGEILASRAQAVTATPFKGPNYFAIHQTVTDGISRVDVDMTDDAASSWQKTLQAFSELGLG